MRWRQARDHGGFIVADRDDRVCGWERVVRQHQLAIDLCDIEWGAARRDAPSQGRVGEDWAIITVFSVPSPNRFIREMTTFLRNEDGSWRRDDERHDNVLIDTALVPALLEAQGLHVTIASSFGTERLPVGLRVLIGHRPR